MVECREDSQVPKKGRKKKYAPGYAHGGVVAGAATARQFKTIGGQKSGGGEGPPPLVKIDSF